MNKIKGGETVYHTNEYLEVLFSFFNYLLFYMSPQI